MKKNKIEDIKGKLIPTARYDEKLRWIVLHGQNFIKHMEWMWKLFP